MPEERKHTFARHGEQSGFTLVELIVVVVIIAILMAGSLYAFQSSRQSSYRSEVKTAARTYQKAIELYRLDHGGNVPSISSPGSLPGTVRPGTWRDATCPAISGQLLASGPANNRGMESTSIPEVNAAGCSSLRSASYISTVPNSVSDGLVCVATNISRCATRTSRAAIVYTSSAPSIYSLTLYEYERRNRRWVGLCYIGSPPSPPPSSSLKEC